MARKLFDKVLYLDDKVEIATSDRGEQSHDIWLGDTTKDRDNRKYMFFDRGILKTLAEDVRVTQIEQTLNNVNRNGPYYLRDEEISPEYFALACARARIREEENFASHLISSKRI